MSLRMRSLSLSMSAASSCSRGGTSSHSSLSAERADDTTQRLLPSGAESGAGSVVGDEEHAFPWPDVVLVSLMVTIDTIALCQIFPYVAFMVESFHMTQDLSQVGYYAGLLASSYSAAVMLSSLFWGKLSDLIGRKPVLQLGMLSTTVMTAVFGLSPNFAFALVARFFQGLLNGNIGVAKTYLGEVLSTGQKARGFAMLGVVDLIGYGLGPLVGGVLSQPADKFPSVFTGWFWRRFPFFLPCAVAASISACGLVASRFVLRETLQRKAASLSEIAHAMRCGPCGGTKRRGILARGRYAQVRGDDSNTSDNGSTGDGLSTSESVVDDETAAEQRAASVTATALRSRDVLVAVTLYSLLCFSYTADEEAFPLLCVAKLAMSSTRIGVAMGVASAASLVGQLLYPLLVRRWGGHLGVHRLSMLLMAPTVVAMPAVAPLQHVLHAEVTFGLVVIIETAKFVLSSYAFTSVIVLISNSAPTSALGQVNGLGQTIAAFARMFAPTTAGFTFAASMQRGTWLGNYFALFVLVAVIMIGGSVLTLALGREMNDSFDVRPGATRPIDAIAMVPTRRAEASEPPDAAPMIVVNQDDDEGAQ